MSIVNGVGVPKLDITLGSGVVVSITFPTLPQAGSGTEDNEQVRLHDAFDNETIPDRLGFKPRWTLDYSGGLDGLFLLSLRHLQQKDVQKIVLTPHIDLPGRKFEVRLTKFGRIEIAGDLNNGMHEGVKLEFESTKLLDAIPYPQAGLTGRTWAGCGTETWADHTADVWHFFT